MAEPKLNSDDFKSQSDRQSSGAYVRFRAAVLGAFVVILGGLMFYQVPVEADSVKDSKSVTSRQKGPSRTWVQIGGKIYGARPDARGPIGGGAGYKKVVTKGDYRPRTLDGLLAALKKAKKGR